MGAKHKHAMLVFQSSEMLIVISKLLFKLLEPLNTFCFVTCLSKRLSSAKYISLKVARCDELYCECVWVYLWQPSFFFQKH